MCSLTSCSRKTKWWTMCVFYGILNAIAINSYLILSDNLEKKQDKPVHRRIYMKDTAMALLRPWAQQRLSHPNLSRTLKNKISRVAEIPSHSSAVVSDLPVLAESNAPVIRCVLCSRGQDRKTKHRQ